MSGMDFDLIAMGGGFSGLTTAARAAQLGLRVAVLEQLTEDRYICNSRYSSGVANVLGNYIGSAEPVLREVLERQTAGQADPELITAYAGNAARVFKWLQDEGLRFVMMFPTAQNKRSAVLAPPRRFKSGVDWEGRGADVSMRRLEANIQDRGGVILRGAKVLSLLMEGGHCTGVEALIDGATTRITARAVALADGGFMANPDMVARHIAPRAEALNVRSAPQAQGEGIRMAQAVGAALKGLGNFYGHLQHREAMTNPRLWPYPTFDAIAQAGILVDHKGHRFTDEGRGGVAMTNVVAKLDDPLSTFVIYDEAMWQGEPGTAGPVGVNPYLAEGGGWAHTADTLPDLAARAGIDAAELVATVEAYNRAVSAGTLADLSPARTTRLFKAHAIVKAPFHAVPLCAGITGTMGGLAIDGHARVRHEDGSVIPGLYAIGTNTSGLEGGPNVAYVGGLSKAFIWGVIAAEHAAGYVGQIGTAQAAKA